MPLFSRSDSGASFFSTLSHLRQKMGQGDFSTTAKSPSPKARVKGDDLPFLLKRNYLKRRYIFIYIYIKKVHFLMLNKLALDFRCRYLNPISSLSIVVA